MWKSKIAGQDGIHQRALPGGEFFHHWSILALLLLVVNDWYLKPTSWAPGLLTGKLSDFAGLLFFPLLLTALLDTLLLLAFRLGLPVDFSLRRGKLALSIAATGLVFTAVKLSVLANESSIELAQRLGIDAHIVRDPTDLVALLTLWLSWKIGLAEIARVPLGRIELILGRHRRSGVVASHSLHDIVPAGADPMLAKDFAEALQGYLDQPSPSQGEAVDAALAKLRDP